MRFFFAHVVVLISCWFKDFYMFYHSVHSFLEVDNIMYLCHSLATRNGEQ